MREFLVFLPLTIAYFALKSTLFAGFPLPDIPLIIVFYMAYRKAAVAGVLSAFAFGYLDDAFSGGIIGTSSFALPARPGPPPGHQGSRMPSDTSGVGGDPLAAALVK